MRILGVVVNKIQISMKITEKNYFNPKEQLTLSISNSALRKYASMFEACSNLEGELPIILDTNILLGYYGMSQQEKGKLIEFLEKFKDRIIITKQVEYEFLKNRLTVIKKDFFGPLNKIADDYNKTKSDIEGLLKSFREKKKKILSQDYPDLFSKLQGIEEEVKSILNDDEFIKEIKDRVEETTSNNQNIALIDELLDKVSKFKITEELGQDERELLEKKFQEHLNDYTEEKEISRWKLAIPGCGETKDDAIGNYLIYHEALKYMLENNTSAIFLTNDVAKGDWLQYDKNPHNHYIEHTFRLTGEILYIIHAEKTLPKISFENIHKTTEDIALTSESDSKANKIFESTIISIDTDKGFGFIYTKDDNLFFRYSDFNGNFRNLSRNDVVRYEIVKDFEGKLKVMNVNKVEYDFDSPEQEIFESEITHINQHRGIGFISHHPENLYFHQAFLGKDIDFSKFEVGSKVEYLIGKNDEGEAIARKVRLKVEPKSE